MTPESKDLLKKLSEKQPLIEGYSPEIDVFGYRSPIEVIVSDMVMKAEDDVMHAVWNVGVNADKEELVKALAYDRDQYAAGYRYAKEKFDRPHGEWAYTTHHGRRFRICSVCKAEKEDDHATGWNFCQYCGSDNRKREGE